MRAPDPAAAAYRAYV